MSDRLAWYLSRPYQEGARGPYVFDCWGLVRWVLIHEFSIPHCDLPAFGGVLRGFGMQEAYHKAEHAFRRSAEPGEGAIACVFERGVLVHIGVVYCGRVLHTREGSHVRHDSIARFERSARVKFYVHD